MRLLCTLMALASLAAAARPQPVSPGRFERFWAARDRGQARQAADDLLRAGVTYDEALRELKTWRTYGPAPAGRRVLRTRVDDGFFVECIVEVPAEYDPRRSCPVRVQLHGGVGRAAPDRAEELLSRPNALEPGTPHITVYPLAWREAPWWGRTQVDHLSRVLDQVRRQYNVDESRVSVTGFSDGATGAFYVGMRDLTAFSAIVPLHGSIRVLTSRSIGVDGQLYPLNLSNRPLYIVNGGRDRLYPTSLVAQDVGALRDAGVDLVFRSLPSAGHSVSWWPAERPVIEQYVRDRPRPSHPPRLTWETDTVERDNRIDWLVIDRLGATPSDAALPDANPIDFARRRASGRVDVTLEGNTFTARTRGVRAFTILVSPDAVRLAQPVKVAVNGRVVFEDVVSPSAQVLLKWAARDADRTRLYAAELRVDVEKGGAAASGR